MKFSVLLLAVIAASVAHQAYCAEIEGPGIVPPFELSPIPARCWNAWGSLVAEWRSNGGGVKMSIAETRAQITADRRSRFAAIVRRAWASQPVPRKRHPIHVGSWPVTHNEFRRLAVNLRFDSDDGLPEGCRSLSWLESYLWDDLLNPDDRHEGPRKLLETPPSMEWDSPFASQWLRYWIFARIE